MSCDPHDGIYIALTGLNGDSILVHDVRMPSQPVTKLKGHLDLIT